MVRSLSLFFFFLLILGVFLAPRNNAIKINFLKKVPHQEEDKEGENHQKKISIKSLSLITDKKKIDVEKFKVQQQTEESFYKEDEKGALSFKEKNIFFKQRPLFKVALPAPHFYESIYGTLRRGLGNPESMQKSFFDTGHPQQTDELFAEYLPLPFSLSSSYMQAVYQPSESFSIIFHKPKDNYMYNTFDVKINFSKRF